MCPVAAYMISRSRSQVSRPIFCSLCTYIHLHNVSVLHIKAVLDSRFRWCLILTISSRRFLILWTDWHLHRYILIMKLPLQKFQVIKIPFLKWFEPTGVKIYRTNSFLDSSSFSKQHQRENVPSAYCLNQTWYVLQWFYHIWFPLIFTKPDPSIKGPSHQTHHTVKATRPDHNAKGLCCYISTKAFRG